MANKKKEYDQRYGHKLNMLEPGTAMLKWIGILLPVGLILRLLQLNAAAYILFGLSGIIFVVLVILLMTELHQDKVLNEIALREERQKEEQEL